MPRRTLTATALLALLLLSTTALAASGGSRRGSGSDRRGDVAASSDLVDASASYVRASGKVRARVSMADFGAASGEGTFLAVYVSKRRHGRCQTTTGSLIGFGFASRTAQAGLARDANPTVPAHASVRGNRISLSAEGARLAHHRYDCAVVTTIAADGNVARVIDKIAFRLR